MENSGEIAGNLTFGADARLTDTGEIQGDVILGAADKLYLGPGGSVGEIHASSRDLFDLNGNIGAVAIDGFTAGDGANHDTLVFSTVFGGALPGLRDAISQVGGNVVIRFDATDSVTLANVSLGSLTGSDLKIV